jgi:hypothetical protein
MSRASQSSQWHSPHFRRWGQPRRNVFIALLHSFSNVRQLDACFTRHLSDESVPLGPLSQLRKTFQHHQQRLECKAAISLALRHLETASVRATALIATTSTLTPNSPLLRICALHPGQDHQLGTAGQHVANDFRSASLYRSLSRRVLIAIPQVSLAAP